MIKKIAWNTFKNTGDINSFLEYKQIENLEKISEIKNTELIDKISKPQGKTNTGLIYEIGKIQNWRINKHGNNKNKWNNISRKQYGRLRQNAYNVNTKFWQNIM